MNFFKNNSAVQKLLGRKGRTTPIEVSHHNNKKDLLEIQNCSRFKDVLSQSLLWFYHNKPNIQGDPHRFFALQQQTRNQFHLKNFLQ